MTRQKVKRQLLDAARRQPTVRGAVEARRGRVQQHLEQVNRDLQLAGRSFADEETTEDEARAEYQRLAERRVRLGLVLAEIGEKAGVQVTDEELQRALFEMVRRYPANQQQEVFDFYRNNPAALATCALRSSRRRWSTICSR
jgi:trigger factor